MSFLYQETTGGSSSSFGAGADDNVGQSFQGGGGALTQATFSLQKTGSPAGNAIVAKLYASTGTPGASAKPTGAALATSTNSVLDTSLGATFADVTFTFSGANVDSGVTYFVVLQYSGNAALVDRHDPGQAGNNYAFGSEGIGWTPLAITLKGSVEGVIVPPSAERGLPANRIYYTKTFGAGGVRE